MNRGEKVEALKETSCQRGMTVRCLRHVREVRGSGLQGYALWACCRGWEEGFPDVQ